MVLEVRPVYPWLKYFPYLGVRQTWHRCIWRDQTIIMRFRLKGSRSEIHHSSWLRLYVVIFYKDLRFYLTTHLEVYGNSRRFHKIELPHPQNFAALVKNRLTIACRAAVRSRPPIFKRFILLLLRLFLSFPHCRENRGVC